MTGPATPQGRPSSQELAPSVVHVLANCECRHAQTGFEALRELDALAARLQTTEQALRQALDCKGSYNGTVSERGGEPAICIKCEEAVRRALEGAAE